MGDSQQDTKKKASYEQWTKEQSDLLLELMVDAAAQGWRDNSGIFTKTTVEERILPVLNLKLGCNKTYNNYQSRLKWFKNRWLSYSNLLRFSSGFGYNYTTKRFTAPDEVWNEYLVAHSKDANLRYGECLDYEDLEIAVGNGVAVGKSSIGLGSETDARTLGDGENRDALIEDLSYDAENEMFVAPTQNDPPFGSTTPLEFPEVSEVSNRRQFLAPLRGVRYHLKDFGGQGRHPRNASELFNLRHASLRNVIERIFGIFKSRFTIFKIAPPFPFQTQAELVLACAGLHNFLRKECRFDEFPIEPEEDQASPHLDMEDENIELLSQSQLEQRAEANAWRESIANAMWEMRPRYNGDENEEGGNEDQNNDDEINE